MKKQTLKKMVPGILLLAFVAVVAVVVLIGGGTNSNAMEKQAQGTLEKLLSCTPQQAEAFGAATSPAEAGTPDGTVIDILSSPDAIAEYFTALYGDCMTEECIDDLIADRIFTRCIFLAQKYDSGISAAGLQLSERSGAEGLYSFSTDLQTSAGDSVATAFGSIAMKKIGNDWKASKITATVKQQ